MYLIYCYNINYSDYNNRKGMVHLVEAKTEPWKIANNIYIKITEKEVHTTGGAVRHGDSRYTSL